MMLKVKGGSGLDLSKINELLPECCTAVKIDISQCSSREKNALKRKLKSVKSIIILAHHIEKSSEWEWTKMESERGNYNCQADLHAQTVIKKIKNYLESKNNKAKIVPYPKPSGVRFKKLAEKSGIGEIGDNHLFLHHSWGPWVHLRVLLTEAEINNNKPKAYQDQICIHCGKCIEACPAAAIDEENFDLEKCRKHQEEMDSSHSCEVCARVCPIGKVPD